MASARCCPMDGGDTAVAIGDEVFGKPANRDHAMTMLRRLSDDTHTVFSAVALVADGVRRHRLSVTEVTFARLGRRQLEQYCDGTEPFDKAGAYGVQDLAGLVGVHSLSGSFYTVMGMPTHRLAVLLADL